MDGPLRLGLTLTAWMVATAFISAAAWALGADGRRVAEAAVVALSPAITGLVLLQRIDKEDWARLYHVLAWALAAAMLTAQSGGATSPATALLIAAPAFAHATGNAQLTVFATFASAAGCLAAVFLAAGIDSDALGLAPVFYAIAALFLCAVIFLTSRNASVSDDDAQQRIAEAAHELRTPLGHMIGFADMIESEIFGPVGKRNREYAALIRASGQQLIELIRGRLDLARISAGRYELELETIDAREIAADVARLAQGSALAKSIVLEQDLPDAKLLIRADAAALRQILTNLLGNAVKFTPQGGRVVLSARASDPSLFLDIADSGPGVAASDRERLMRPFERSAAARGVEGAGLGLALVHALVRLHGGDVRLVDAPNGGLLARVRLPLRGPGDGASE